MRRGRAQGKQVITGAEVIALQAVEQFVLYTGVRPTGDQVRRSCHTNRWPDPPDRPGPATARGASTHPLKAAADGI